MFLVPSLVVVLGVIVVALVGLLVTRTTLAALPATIAQLWLIINLVPVTADGITLGVLPLLPTIGLIALVARRIHVAVRRRVSIADLLVIAVGILLVPLVLTLIAAAMMWDAGRVFDVGPPPLGHAVARTLLVHGLAFVLGMGGRLWRALLRRYGAPDWWADAAATAVRILSLWAGAALVLLLVLLVAGWSRQAEVLSVYNSGAGYAGTVLISLLYLPNAVFAAATVMLGSEFHIGASSISLYAIDLTALPPMPLFALIPGWAHQWSILLLLVTSMAVAYVLGSVRFTVVQTLAAAGIVALLVLVTSYFTTGQVGYLGVAGPMAWLTAGLAFAWTAGIGVAAALVGKLADSRARASAAPEEDLPMEEPVLPEDEELEVLEGDVVEEATEDTSGETGEEPAAEEAGAEDPEEVSEEAEEFEEFEEFEHPVEAVAPEESAEAEVPETPEAPEAPEEPDEAAEGEESEDPETSSTPVSPEEGDNSEDPGSRD